MDDASEADKAAKVQRKGRARDRRRYNTQVVKLNASTRHLGNSRHHFHCHKSSDIYHCRESFLTMPYPVENNSPASTEPLIGEGVTSCWAGTISESTGAHD